MPDPLVYVQAMMAAAAVSAILVLAVVVMRRPASVTSPNAVCVVGMGLGLTVGYYLLSTRLAWPPANGLDRMLTIVIPLALGIELISGLQSTPRWVAWLLRLSLSVAMPRILLHGSVYLRVSADESTLWRVALPLAGCAAVLAGTWTLLAWLSYRSPGVSIPFALCLSTLCAGLTVMMAGYLKGGAAAFPLAATVLATTVATWLIKRRVGNAQDFGAQAILGIGVVGLFGVLFIGRCFGELSTIDLMTMFFAPLLCWVTEWPPLRHRKPWLVGSLRMILVAIPLTLVLGVAKRDFDRDMGPLLGQTQSYTRWKD